MHCARIVFAPTSRDNGPFSACRAITFLLEPRARCASSAHSPCPRRTPVRAAPHWSLPATSTRGGRVSLSRFLVPSIIGAMGDSCRTGGEEDRTARLGTRAASWGWPNSKGQRTDHLGHLHGSVLEALTGECRRLIWAGAIPAQPHGSPQAWSRTDGPS